MNAKKPRNSAPVVQADTLIRLVRGQRVMLDSDLAALYGVETKGLKRAVRRNAERFPADFMFQLTAEEVETLRCQIGTSNIGRGGSRYLPFVFTQEGIAMPSSVLRSERAVAVNIAIMRAFVRLREMTLGIGELAVRVDALERGFAEHGGQFRAVFDALRQLMSPPEKPRRAIGFQTGD